MTLPWQKNPAFFSAVGNAGKHHFIPKAAFLRRYLEPAEWAGQTKRANHLRELDLGSGEIAWKGVNLAGQGKNLNTGPTLSSEPYWGLDDSFLADCARRVEDEEYEWVLAMVPGIAAMWLRPPSIVAALQKLAPKDANPKDWAVGAQIVLADRVKSDWVAALDLGAVKAVAEVIPETADRRFVVGDVPVSFTQGGSTTLDRPPWLWEEEWFPAENDPEPAQTPPVELAMPVSSRVHLRISVDLCVRTGSGTDVLTVSEDEGLELNRRSAERAVQYVWSGRSRDLRDLK